MRFNWHSVWFIYTYCSPNRGMSTMETKIDTNIHHEHKTNETRKEFNRENTLPFHAKGNHLNCDRFAVLTPSMDSITLNVRFSYSAYQWRINSAIRLPSNIFYPSNLIVCPQHWTHWILSDGKWFSIPKKSCKTIPRQLVTSGFFYTLLQLSTMTLYSWCFFFSLSI